MATGADQSETSATGGCPVCGSVDHSYAFRRGEFDIERCTQCSHVYVLPSSDRSALAPDYGESYYRADAVAGSAGYRDYVGDAERRLKGFAQQLASLERFTGGRGSLLDFGCAIGLFVKVARDAGWDACGYERSAWAAEYGRKSYGVALESGPDPACMAAGVLYDLITMWDVLEHVESPLSTVRQLASHVRPGGFLALNTVNIGSLGARLAGEHWRHIAPPFHLHYFTRKSLRHLLELSGLEILAWLPRGVCRWADPRRQAADGGRSMLEAMVTHWRFAPVANALDLLDEVEVIARRRPAA